MKGGSLTASDLGAVSAADKGQAGGIAGLGDDGKVPSSQLPAMNYEGKGAVDTHNKSTTAHKELFAKKLDKLTGKKGQFAGFTEDNVVGAMDAPQRRRKRLRRWRAAGHRDGGRHDHQRGSRLEYVQVPRSV